MPNPALSKRRAAAVERASRANAVHAGGRADVESAHPAPGMEGPDPGKAWRNRPANVDS